MLCGVGLSAAVDAEVALLVTGWSPADHGTATYGREAGWFWCAVQAASGLHSVGDVLAAWWQGALVRVRACAAIWCCCRMFVSVWRVLWVRGWRVRTASRQ